MNEDQVLEAATAEAASENASNCVTGTPHACSCMSHAIVSSVNSKEYDDNTKIVVSTDSNDQRRVLLLMEVSIYSSKRLFSLCLN